MGFSDTFNNRHELWKKAEKQIGYGSQTPVRKKRHPIKLEKSSKKSKNYHPKKPYQDLT